MDNVVSSHPEFTKEVENESTVFQNHLRFILLAWTKSKSYLQKEPGRVGGTLYYKSTNTTTLYKYH